MDEKRKAISADDRLEGWNEAIERVALWHEEKATLLGAHDDIEWRVASDQHTRMAAMFRDWKCARSSLMVGASGQLQSHRTASGDGVNT